MSRIRWNTKLVSEEMQKENCTLIDDYTRGDNRIRYSYEGNIYSVRWNDWLKKTRPSRPHLAGGNRNTKPHDKWNNEKVNELFNKENCELADEYRSTKQRLRYKFNNSYYWTTLDDWIYHNSRPHISINENENRFRKYLEARNIEFVTQKSFSDLKSANNYSLRFDFYLPEMNLLVEIDDRSHVSLKKQVEKGRMKDKYCIDNHIKLLRIDETVSDEKDFEHALNNILEDNIYVLKYGSLYKNYNGTY